MKRQQTTFEKRFESLSLSPDELSVSMMATISPAESSKDPELVLSALPEFVHGLDLEIAETLNEGGMGVIRLARQKGLGRDVAVKSVREQGDKQAVAGLVKEAHVTGLVEHPNVVPVHALGRDVQGEPLLVMKRVQGVSWSAILEDPSFAPDGDADLRWHLHVLLQVCNALRIAHKHGIVHRDIKPENVMVGEYGEVYLMDWGLAIALDGRDNPLLPARESARGFAGTPAYMAPEMTLDTPDEVDVRTDVYLLGATLHHVITGSPPHLADNMFETLRNAFEAKTPEYSADVPEMLADIARRALQAEKDDRFQSVDEFRQAIERYLKVRGAIALTDAADAVLKEIERRIVDSPADAEVLEMFAECRFGFKQAIVQWDENQRAKEGLQSANALLVTHHVRMGNLSAAQATLAQMDLVPAEVQAIVNDALEAKKTREARVNELERWAQEFDPRVGSRGRAIAIGVLGLYWVGTSIYSHFTMDLSASPEALRASLWSVARTVGVGGLVVFWMRHRLFGTEASRRIISVLIAVMVCIAVARVSGFMAVQEVVVTARSEMLVYTVGVAAVGFMTQRRIAYSAIFYLVGIPLSAVWPSMTYAIIAVANVLVFAWAVFNWRAGQD